MLKLLFFSGWFLLFCPSLTSVSAQADCLDSARIVIVPVQCYSFRNGLIKVDSIYGGGEIKDYYYSIDGMTFSQYPEFERLWPGDYTLTVKNDYGCLWERLVTVPSPPVLEVSLSADRQLVRAGESVTLTATVRPPDAIISDINWRPPAFFEINNGYQQAIKVPETTTFAVEIVNNQGCTARDQFTVEVRPPDIFAPNVIQVGSNENAWFTLFSDETIHHIEALQIYNRAGGMVFERFHFPPNDPLLGWNGRTHGRKVQDGVFIWLARVRYLDGSVHQHQGTLTVLR